MSPDTTVWVLNLDAEIELGRLHSWLAAGRTAHNWSYATPKSLQALIDAYAQHFAAQLPPSALVLTGDVIHSPKAAGAVGLSWCPTPTAIARLERVGARPAAAPPPEVLLRVNHRKFCSELGQSLSAARFVETLTEMSDLLSQPSPTGGWLCKRPLGFSGRGQRRISTTEGATSHLRSDNLRWLSESIPHGGLQIEPLVSIVAEYSIHGLVKRDKQFTLGRLCQQHVDEHRAWLRAELASPTALCNSDRERLTHEASRVASNLAEAGYFGPFSLDAFSWKDSAGNLQFNPRSEINARMTMAYPIGMGDGWLEELSSALAY